MLFNSLAFLIFFPLTTLIYFLIPYRFRWLWLLLISAYFYMSFVPVYILILVVTIVIDFFSGRFIERSVGRSKKMFLFLSIFTNAGMLFFFKYFNFFNENLSIFTGLLNVTYHPLILKIALPIGLSFHVFQSISYTVEVYRGHQKAESNIGVLALYVLFYPQLVAGPIERPQNLLHQFYEHHQFEIRRVLRGLALMLGGFLKKIVIADRLSQFVDPVFNSVGDYSGISFVIALVFFAFQIYCDFSGYVDVARGAAEVLGFRLMDNFRQPYFAISVGDFWKRWNISLSSWLRDYVYIPLGGSRVSAVRWAFNITVTFLLSGLWHGANWTYVFWGALHASYLIVERFVSRLKSFFPKFLIPYHFVILFFQRIWTFSVILIAWAFFRAHSFHDAWYMISHLKEGWSQVIDGFSNQQFLHHSIFMGYEKGEFLIGSISILILLVFEFFQRKGEIRSYINRQPLFVISCIYSLGLLALLVFGKFSGQEFIYFQF